MSHLNPLESLMIKQTCRSFAYKFEMDTNKTAGDTTAGIYSLEFLKCLHDRPADHISRILEASLAVNREAPTAAATDEFNVAEKRILLDFFKRVNEMKSHPAKQWTDLQHYLCFVYRYCMTSHPDPEEEILSPYFIADMRKLVTSLMEDDQIQLCLKLFSLVREYTIFAHKQLQKITSLEASIESLFYYYEAFLSATRNICQIFPELEKLLRNTYKLGWLDFNTSIFMYYFYETNYVQNMIQEFELMNSNVSLKAGGIYTVLTELHKLWKSQMTGINNVITIKFGTKFKNTDNKMMLSHKKILSKNFWIERTTDEKLAQDTRLFDYELFSLVGDKMLELPEPTLDESGQCICEDCLIIKYKAFLELNQNKIETESMKVSCRFCKQQVDLDHFQQHVNGRALAEIGENKCSSSPNLSRILSDKIDLFKKLETNAKSPNKKDKPDSRDYPYANGPANSEFPSESSMKIASEPPIFKNNLFDNEVAATKLEFQEFIRNRKQKCSPITSKTIRNFFRIQDSLTNTETDNNNKTEPVKIQEKQLDTTIKQSPTKNDHVETKTGDVLKTSKGTNTSNKNMPFPCGHNCKLEEELKSEFKKAYQETCDHHKDSKKCDCTFCEVFGTTSHTHKTNETRNRLRIRLNQRNEKVSNKPTVKNVRSSANNVQKSNTTKTENITPAGKVGQFDISTPSSTEDTNSNPSLIHDIHGLLNYIEGNTNVDKLAALAEKKAAKKARQRMKKEQEKQRIEDEERKRVEEEKRQLEERLRNEELSRQLAEKIKNRGQQQESKKDAKKKKKNKLKGVGELIEETIPAMVTIKRVVENNNAPPTVTITLKGSTPDQDKLLYTLVNGHEGKGTNQTNETKKNNKKNKNSKETTTTISKTVNLELSTNKNDKKKNKKGVKTHEQTNNIITKELRVTLALDPASLSTEFNKKNTKTQTKNSNKTTDTSKLKNTNDVTKKVENKKNKKNKDSDFNIPLLRLPPGITITKVDGPMTDRNYKTNSIDNPPYNSNIPVSKSGVIVVDTEKLIKQSSISLTNTSSTTTTSTTTVVPPVISKKSKKKRNKQKANDNNGIYGQSVITSTSTTTSLSSPSSLLSSSSASTNHNKPSMVTLKNPIFQNMHTSKHEPEIITADLSGQCQQASIFKNENGMVTIRSSRLQASLANGSPVPNLLSDLKPVLGPEVPTPYMSSCSFSDTSRMSPFNAQEILSGLPGIEITKVDKNSTKHDLDSKKSCHTAEVSIIPASNGDKFNFDKDDWHYDSVFTPKDILEDDMDADERELEAFKRFCQQSVPPKQKEKVAHLNVKDIVLKKKNNKVSGKKSRYELDK